MILTDEDRRGKTEGEKTEDESIPRPLAEAYTGHFLAPALKRGLVVVMDNPSAHKGERVRRPIENGGWELLQLPTYSPDPNRIEKAFSTIKRLSRLSGDSGRGMFGEAIPQGPPEQPERLVSVQPRVPPPTIDGPAEALRKALSASEGTWIVAT